MEEGLLDEAPIWSDLESFDGEPWRGLVDGVVGGVPCQPHSHAGQREGIFDERWLWRSVERILDETGAWWLLLENVDGLRTSSGGQAFGQVLQGLARRGFVLAWCVLGASDVGAPHKRKRVFLLAIKGSHLEHAQGARQPAERLLLREEPEEAGAERSTAQRGGGRLADPDDERRDEGKRGRKDAPRRSQLDGGSEELADSNSEAGRPEERIPVGGPCPEAAGCGPEEPGQHGVRPRWPPGPKDLDAWSAVLDQWPDLAPAVESPVRGVVDGLPHWVDGNLVPRDDRLRGLGNAVVRQQAEAAFILLWEHITGGP